MFDPTNQEDRLLFLLNSFAGSVHQGPWKVQKSSGFHLDSFGNAIQSGEICFERNGGAGKPRRLSVASALRIWELLIADNDREQDFVESMRLAGREFAREDAEAEAESREDEREDD